ncbi:MAG: dihydropyrimidinase, partial [Candidatus Hodarchaeales archaeon]
MKYNSKPLLDNRKIYYLILCLSFDLIDLVIKNGKVVFPNITIETGVAINDGRITAVGSNASNTKSERVIDAQGKFILPGGIDPHVHIQIPFMKTTTNDDFFLTTKAACSGGTTTIIDFAMQEKGSTLMEAVQKRREQADNKVVIDYSLHPTITDLNPENLGQIKNLINYGLPSFKLFMVYREKGLMVDDGTLLKVFNEAKSHGGLVGLHTENVEMIEYLVTESLREGHNEAIYHALTRPPITEAEAINRALFIADYLNVPYYNFHLSLKNGVELFREARRKRKPVDAETCPHFLVNTVEDLKGENGMNFICTPPLRSKEDQEALWKGLADGVISLVSSDHCAYTTEMKKQGGNSFDKVPHGMPGLEFRLPILFSEGVRKRGISINRLSEIASTNAAKIFGLYPKKGIISV